MSAAVHDVRIRAGCFGAAESTSAASSGPATCRFGRSAGIAFTRPPSGVGGRLRRARNGWSAGSRSGLSAAEAEALFLTGFPAAAAQLGLAPARNTAQLKLEASLPAELRDRVGRTTNRLHFDLPPWYAEAEDVPHLAMLADATRDQHAVRIRYLRWAEPHEITRSVQPHGLVLKAGLWYLVARGDGRFRTYRIARILSADALPDPFDRVEGFDLASHWNDYLGQFERRRHQATAVLRLTRRGVGRLPHLLGPAMSVAAQRSAVGPDPDGWTEVALPIESVEAALPELFKLGADAEIVAPAGLREEMIQTLRAMCRRYAGEDWSHAS